MPKSHPTYPQWPLAQYADKILVLELFWPFPLIVIGILRILEPLLVGAGIGLVLLPWLARWFVLGRPGRPTFIGRALVLLGISGLVGIWASYDLRLSLPLFFTLLGSIALFFAIINAHVSPWFVSRGIVMAAALLAGYFVSQYGHFNYLLELGRLARLGRVTGSLLPDLVFFTPHPNAAAGFLEGTLFLGLILGWRASGGKRIAWGLGVALIGYGLLISGSRGAWLGLAVAGVVGVIRLIPYPGWRLGLTGVGVAGVAMVVLMISWLTERGWSSRIVASLMNTASSRLTLYHNSLNLWGDYPFTGIGLGNTFALVYSRYQLLIPYEYLNYSHNLFLAVGLGLGVLGLVALVWLLFEFYSFVMRVERTGLNGTYLALFRAAWLGTTVNFIHGLTDSPQLAGSGWTMPMLFALLGLTVSAGSSSLEQETSGEIHQAFKRNQLQGWAFVAGLALPLMVALAIFWQSILSAWYANMGAIYETRYDLSPALDDPMREATKKLAVDNFNHALFLNSTQPVARWRLGLIALEQQNFETAINYLEPVYRQMPANQAILKALGFAYLWNNQLDAAEELLRQRDDRGEVVEELGYWSWWWGDQSQPELSSYATEMARRLAVDQ